ncbi:hypothetical protein D3C81_2311890 [compost metagenome]
MNCALLFFDAVSGIEEVAVVRLGYAEADFEVGHGKSLFLFYCNDGASTGSTLSD